MTLACIGDPLEKLFSSGLYSVIVSYTLKYFASDKPADLISIDQSSKKLRPKHRLLSYESYPLIHSIAMIQSEVHSNCQNGQFRISKYTALEDKSSIP